MHFVQAAERAGSAQLDNYGDTPSERVANLERAFAKFAEQLYQELKHTLLFAQRLLYVAEGEQIEQWAIQAKQLLEQCNWDVSRAIQSHIERPAPRMSSLNPPMPG